jgi:hypothetical protein
LWDQIEPAFRRLGRGEPAPLDAASVEALASACVDHAQLEEHAVLPLAERILKHGDQAALGMAMRRNPARARGYI